LAAVHRNGLRAAVLGGGLSCILILGGAAVAGTAGVAGACAIVAALWWTVYFSAERIVLSALRARAVSEVERPDLYRLVRELSTSARLPAPRLYISPAMQPNAFTVGCTARTAALCCTEGLLRSLNPAELRAVLGHELAHVSRRDIALSSATAWLAAAITCVTSVGWLLRRRRDPLGDRQVGLLEGALLVLFAPVAALIIQIAVSGGREYGADTTGALLAGDPLALASALRKIEAGAALLPLTPSGQLAAASHLMIANPFLPDGLVRIFATHPPTGERIRRLESLAGYRR
jgi:heat shock protein HtpX